MQQIYLLLLLITFGEAAKILAIFPTPSFSHQSVFQPIWKELSKNHEITVLTPNPLRDPTLTNLTEIDLSEISAKAWEKYNLDSMGSTEDSQQDVRIFYKMYHDLAEAHLTSPQFQEFLKNSKKYKFDVFIVEHLWHSYYGFKEIYNCPMIGISSLPFSILHNRAFGNPMHPIIHPDPMLLVSNKMSFPERVKSTSYYIFSFFMGFVLSRRIEDQVVRHFGDLGKNIMEISAEMSLGIQTFNPVLLPQTPNVPAVIGVTGLHIRPQKKLPENIQTILDSAKKGVVYFSLGSNVKSSSLPKGKLRMIVDAFAELPYQVLWKFETDKIDDLPENVHIFSWLPQQDILRHRNIKVFVSQCGLQSTEEAIYSEVPIIGIPFFADQHRVAQNVEDAGIGKKLDFLTLNKNQLRDTIIEVAENQRYKQKLSSLVELISDKPMTSLQTAIWWIEYVIRHRGAEILRSPMVDIPFYQYLLLDVIAFYLLSIFISSYVLIKLTNFVLRMKFII